MGANASPFMSCAKRSRDYLCMNYFSYVLGLQRLTLRMVSATMMTGLLRMWANAKTWTSSKLSYSADDSPSAEHSSPVNPER